MLFLRVTLLQTGGETGVQSATGQAAQRQAMFTGLAVFLGLVTAFQSSALQLYFLMSGIMGAATGWLLRQNGFRRFIGIRTLPSKESTELYTRVTKGELKLNDIKGPDGRVRYQAPAQMKNISRRQLSGINVKSTAAIPAHLQAPKAPVGTGRNDRDDDFEEGAQGKSVRERLDYYRRNYRLSYIYRRMMSSVDNSLRKLGYGGPRVSPEAARRKKRAEEYEAERKRRFLDRS
jgi:YidC/Oxa1 family membrane protein insertase